MSRPARIVLDVMGGDHAPRAMLDGAYDYAQAHPEVQLHLVGAEDQCKPLMNAKGSQPDNIVFHHAADVVKMDDKLADLKDKPDNSITRSVQLVAEDKADAVVLCGNTACCVAAAQLHLRRIKGVKRAGILTPLPHPTGMTWVIDCGANAVGKPEHMGQFAEMASVFLQQYNNGVQPTIGVLSIGSEDNKGDELTKETLDLLRQTDLKVIGNVEGNDIYKGTTDIVVCDGFTGNVVLKASEGVASAISKILKEELMRTWMGRIAAVLAKPAFNRLRQRTHWSLVGGCPLLGVDGVTIIGHGRSDRVAVYHAIRQAARAVDTDVMGKLRPYFGRSAVVDAAS